ncbi:hypothetical protein [Kaistia adipata]|nr:hypothetical protein [Kaistia adipata]
MSAAAVIAITAIVAAFALFMLSLAYAERQTRNLTPQAAPVRAAVRAARP